MINMIPPEMTDTEINFAAPEKTRLMTTAITPLRKLAKPDYIAVAVSLIASELAGFVTGETIRINGDQVKQ